jgi:hypothetical protein
MLTIEISHKGVDAVRVVAENELEQDLDLLVWPLVRRDIERLDKRLRHEADALLSRIAPTPGSNQP